MLERSLLNIDEFIKFKDSKDVEYDIIGDISNISKLEVELNKKYKKFISVDVNKGCSCIKMRDVLFNEINTIASSFGLTLSKKANK